jgi:hypothetical protein
MSYLYFHHATRCIRESEKERENASIPRHTSTRGDVTLGKKKRETQETDDCLPGPHLFFFLLNILVNR